MNRAYIITIVMIIAIVIAYACFYNGYKLLQTKHTAVATAKVTSINHCTKTQDSYDGIQSNYYCQIMIEFYHGNSLVQAGPIEVNNIAPYYINDTINLRYDPENPMNIVQESSPIVWGWSLLGIGVIILSTGCLFATGEL